MTTAERHERARLILSAMVAGSTLAVEASRVCLPAPASRARVRARLIDPGQETGPDVIGQASRIRL